MGELRRHGVPKSDLPANLLRAAKGLLRIKGKNVQALREGIYTLRAVEMRLQGCSWDAIAYELNMPDAVVFKLVERHLDAQRETTSLNIEHLRDVESRRLDMYLVALLPGCKRGEVSAINTALAVQARRARLLGLDLSPEQAAVQISDNRTQIIATPEAVREALSRARRPDRALVPA